MARKARKKSENQQLKRWLKYLAPALLLPVVVVGGLYAGVILLTETPVEESAGTPLQTAEKPQNPAASEPAEPESALPVQRRPHASGPVDIEELRITDTLVRDGGTDETANYLPNNSGLPSSIEAKPEVKTAVKAEPAPSNPRQPEKPQNTPQEKVIPPLWLRNATAPKAVKGQPMIAVVIDDLGPNLKNARRTITLPAPLTLAFLPYANHLEELTGTAKAAGHELIVHMPMEPEEKSQNPGENALLTGLAPEELERRLRWSLERFSGYVGLNNHMGSKFTKSEAGMRLVMSELAKRGLLFLDSRTIAESRAAEAAEAFMVPFAQRDIFIDNDHENRTSIRAQLVKLEALARRQGYAVAIGHPHDGTLEVLAEWLPMARKKGFALVPISEVVKQRLQLARAATPSLKADDGRTDN